MYSDDEIISAEKLYLIVHDHRYDFIYKVFPNSRDWKSHNWQTVVVCFNNKTKKSFNPTLSDKDILNLIYGKKISIFSISKKIYEIYLAGVRFGAFTKYFVLDVDVNSEYHNIDALNKLLELFKHIGKPVFLRSSNSNGWHLRWYFDKPVKTWLLASYLKDLLKNNGFIIEGGKLEIFPNRKATRETLYNAIRLPCQKGSALLNLEDERVLADWSEDPEIFLCHWASEVTKNLIDTSKLNIFNDKQFSNPITQSWYNQFQAIKEKGFTEYSQTNRLLGKIAEGYRLFKGISDVGELTKILCNWIDKKHNGLSEEYNQNPKIAYYHCERWAICAIKNRRPINKLIKDKKVNNIRIAKSAQYDHYFNTALEQGTINLSMSQRKIAHILGISRKAIQNRVKKGGSFCWLLLLLWSHLYPFYRLGLSAVLC